MSLQDPAGRRVHRRAMHGARSLLLASAVLALAADPVAASEGGASHYVQGMQGDFAMALIGPAGWYVRNDVVYMDANRNPSGKFSCSTGITAYSDYGDYDPDRPLQYGRNYWSWDVTGSLTWLDPKTGREFSVTGGFMFNEENPATDYETGDEFHLDFMLAQHLSAKLGIGPLATSTTR
jgi:hypothetical protein